MTDPRPRSRLAAAALAAVAASLLAFPAVASGHTRVVDDDGKASATDCGASTPAPKSIQKAIDASGAGDTVKVCPGTYRERVSITGARAGLQLLSTTALGATIKDPDVYLPVMPPLVSIKGVANITIKGFKIRTLSWESYLSNTMDGIVADGAIGVAIRGNDLGWAGASGDRSNLLTGITAKGGTTGLIKSNHIRDPLDIGILVDGTGTNVTVQGNTVDALFAGQPGIDALYGVQVHGGATAQVKGGTITAADDAGIISRLASGVELSGAAKATTVSGVTIVNPIVGIRTAGDGYTISGNTVTGHQIGIELVSTDKASVTGNTSRATGSIGDGIAALEASDNNQIVGNTVKNSFGPDCYEADGNHDGIDNLWSQNVSGPASDADPHGLCTDGDVPG